MSTSHLSDTPTAMINSSDTVVVYTQQQNTSFTCYAEGNPLPKIEWYNSAGSVNQSNSKYTIETDKFTEDDVTISTLTILSIEQEDSGVYVCNASNTIGYSVLNETLTVHGK